VQFAGCDGNVFPEIENAGCSRPQAGIDEGIDPQQDMAFTTRLFLVFIFLHVKRIPVRYGERMLDAATLRGSFPSPPLRQILELS
jgi:hypothetical protein